jgi:hypothetical protein
MNFTPFSYQLSELECRAINTYSYEMLDSKSTKDIDNARDRTVTFLSDELPELVNADWFISLHNVLVERMKDDLTDESRKKRICRSPLSSYLISLNTSFNSLAFIKDKPMRRLAGLESRGFDITAPHLRWINTVDTKLTELVTQYPEIKDRVIFKFLMTVPNLDITIEDYSSIYEEFLKSDYVCGMDLADYVEWFVSSSKKVNGDTLTDKYANKIAPTLAKWVDGKKYDSETLYWLTRNFEFHPRHEAIVDAWAKTQCSAK